MIYKQITEMLHDNKDKVKKMWLDEINTVDCDRSKQGPTGNYFSNAADFVLDNFEDLLSENFDKSKICEVFSKVGFLAYEDGYAVHDLVSFLSILKKNIFKLVQKGDFYDTALDLHKLNQFNNNAVKVFDRATFYTAMGFEEALRISTEDKSGFDKVIKFFKSSKPKKEVVNYCSSCTLDE